MIISRTPFRISFFGGGTDYPEWFSKQGGQVLATTIDKYCYLTCRYLPPFFGHRIRVVYSAIEICNKVEEIQHPVVREVLTYLKIDRGIEIHHDGDLPARSGMGTSSSFTVGLLNAMYALQGKMPTKHQLAAESIHIEHDRMREVVGCQDQVMVAHGGFNQVTFSKDGEFIVQPLTLPIERVDQLNDHLMLFYTGISRTGSDVAGTYVDGLDDREKQLNAMSDMVTEGVSILSGGNDILSFGSLLNEAWELKRSIGAKISNSAVDLIYERARGAGALGGKLLGAGGGGFMLLFVPPYSHARVRHELKSLINVPFKFESSGSRIIYYDQEQDYSHEDTLRDTQSASSFNELDSKELTARLESSSEAQ